MADDTIMPCAIKTMKYATEEDKAMAELELVALKAALGKRSLVQCLGAIEMGSGAGDKKLIILNE